MNPFEMVIGIVLIVTIGGFLKAKYRHRHYEADPAATVENQQLKDEVRSLKERIQVLERITIEKENSLERQIEQLRDR